MHAFYTRWSAQGVVGQLLDQLHQRLRRERGRNVRAVTVVIDSQTVKAAETVAKASRGYDAGKKINGRKRGVVVDLGGLPLMVMVVPADVQDRDLARDLLWRLRLAHPQVTLVYADSAYGGALVGWAKRFLSLTITVVNRPPGATGFVVLPLGRREDTVLAAAGAAQRPRLRTPAPPQRSSPDLDRDHPDDPAPGPRCTEHAEEAGGVKPEDIQIGETYRVHIPRRDNPSRHLTSDQARPDVDIALIQLYIAGDNDFALTVTGVAERLRDEPAVTGVRVVDTSHVRVPLAPEVAQARGLPPGVDYLVDGSLLDARTGDFVELTTDQTLTVPLRWLRPHA